MEQALSTTPRILDQALSATPRVLNNAAEAEELLAILGEGPFFTLEASLAVHYDRKGETQVSDVTSDNSYRGIDDKFVLTVQLMVNKWDPRFDRHIQPLVTQAEEEKAEEERLRVEADRIEKAVRLVAMKAEVERLEAELSN